MSSSIGLAPAFCKAKLTSGWGMVTSLRIRVSTKILPSSASLSARSTASFMAMETPWGSEGSGHALVRMKFPTVSDLEVEDNR